MGWYGIFLVKKLKLAFSLSKIDKGKLFDDFELIEKFMEKYDKARENINYVQEVSEKSKSFSAKAIAKMFNIIDDFYLPETSNAIFLLYFLDRFDFEIDYEPGDQVDLSKLKKEGWEIIQ
jgi:hypothetical protein